MELAIERLAPKYRHVIILKYYQDMTLTEIAQLLERPEGTVKTWLNQALKALRSDFGKEGGFDYA
ncbi:sigma-70 family RNA polymerase sigma factor [Paenibacillus sp. P25]|nr:sigma-70 family RNA polymerase sigma factor [Paenibacillus sp. P25]